MRERLGVHMAREGRERSPVCGGRVQVTPVNNVGVLFGLGVASGESFWHPLLFAEMRQSESRSTGMCATRRLLPPHGREFGARESGSGDSVARLREEALDEPSLEEEHGNRREDGQAAEGLDAPKCPVKHCVLRQGQRCDALGGRRDTNVNVPETQRLQRQQSKSERVRGFVV